MSNSVIALYSNKKAFLNWDAFYFFIRNVPFSVLSTYVNPYFITEFASVCAPAESLETYKTATNWSVHASRIVPMTKSMRLKYPPR